MFYVIALLMGIFITINMKIERSRQMFIGNDYISPMARKMSLLGGFGGWYCVLPAAYFVGTSEGNSFIDGFVFCMIAVIGPAPLFITKVSSIHYLLSPFTLPINIMLLVLTYKLTD